VVALLAGCGGSGDDENGTTSMTATQPGSTRAISGPWAGRLTQAGLAPFTWSTPIEAP